MKRLDLTLPTAAENVALDEALLDFAEENGESDEYLRTWESAQPIVVVGRSSRLSEEVDEAACRSRNIPIVRRSSGGAAIVAGHGCLMYAVVLSHAKRPELKDIGRAHAHVLDRMASAFATRLHDKASVLRAGTSDLVIVEPAEGKSTRKFSGNSMRMKRSHLLYHGTLLYDFDLSLIGDCLKLPPRQPGYRERRSHADFVANIFLTRQAVIGALSEAWATNGDLVNWPRDKVETLVTERFVRDSWTREF